MQDKKLYLRRETTEIRDGQLVSTIWYQCEDCSGCSGRAQCWPGKVSIRTELFLLVLAFDLKKLWMKREPGRLRTHASLKMTL